MRMLVSAVAGVILAVGICASASAKAPLRGTIVDSGNGAGSSLPVGNDQISSATVNCEAKQGCELIVASMVEIVAGDGLWAICPTVDGVQMDPPCGSQGVVQTGGSSTVTGNGWSNAAVLTHGSHTVATVLSIHHASSLDAWQVSYIFWPLRR